MFPRSAIGFDRRGSSMNSSTLMSWLGFLVLARNFIPPEIQYVFQQFWALFVRPMKYFCLFHIHRVNEENGKANDLYTLVETYLKASELCKEADQVVLTSQSKQEKNINYKLTGRESVVDTFEGVTVWWSLSSGKASQTQPIPRRSRSDRFWEPDLQPRRGTSSNTVFVLKMRKKDKQFVMTEYLDHVVAEAEEFKRQQRDIKLWGHSGTGRWRSHLFKHPSTFDTLAMKPELKAAVKADLDAFRNSEKYFRRVGRAWKRGYLLHGPPGTGKSSMIAAMANYLKYDVYDLELTQVHSNDALKRMLVDTKSRSIIVIEDIDCSLNLTGQRDGGTPFDPRGFDRFLLGGGRGGSQRSTAVTLSGLLNSTDGLWSSSTDERMMIFTTNHVEKLDAALIRPGRMDMHIHMSYCSFESIKQLAGTYFSIDTHPCYDTIRRFLDEGSLITPAQVTEHLFGNHDDPNAAIEALVAKLQMLKASTASKP